MLKIIKLLNVFILSVGLLTACGGGGGGPSTTTPSSTGTTTPTSSGTATTPTGGGTTTPPAGGGTTDSVSPVVSAPANISITAASGATAVAATQSAIATFLSAATATDNVGVVGAITNDAPANFPVGVTTVTFTATDAANNSGTATATVTVNATSGGSSDITPPVITPPANIYLNMATCTGFGCPQTAIYNYNPLLLPFLNGATALDNIDGNLTASITHDLATVTGIGLNDGNIVTVTFSVTDAAGNIGTATANIIIDRNPPEIIIPAGITAPKTTATGALLTDAVIANFLASAMAVDAAGVSASITNNAPANFPVGSTIVSLSVTDLSGQTATTTTTIDVYDPATPPVAPTNVTIQTKAKNLKISWAGSNAHHYKVLYNPDGASGFTVDPYATNVTTLSFAKDIAVHQLNWVNGQFIIEACDQAEVTCVQSVATPLTTALENSATIFVKAYDPVPNSVTDVTQNSYFGSDIDITPDGLTMVVGSKGSATRGAVSRVYVLKKVLGKWQFDTSFYAANYDRGDEFGASVSISDDGLTIAVGAPSEASGALGINGNELDNTTSSAGAAYIFTKASNVWGQQAYIKPDVLQARGSFGSEVVISSDGNTLLTMRGGLLVAAYVFSRTGSSWTQQFKTNVTASSIAGVSKMIALSKDGNTFAFKPLKNNATEIYTRAGVNWLLQASLTPAGSPPLNSFGNSLTYINKNLMDDSGNNIVIGGNSSTVFTRTAGTWSEGATISSSALSFSPDSTMLATMPVTTAASNSQILLWTQASGIWNQKSTIIPSNRRQITGTGWSVTFGRDSGASNVVLNNPIVFSADNKTLVVGAEQESSRSKGGVDQPVLSSSVTHSGAVYVY